MLISKSKIEERLSISTRRLETYGGFFAAYGERASPPKPNLKAILIRLGVRDNTRATVT